MITRKSGILILMRHGQSQWNQENRFTGWADVPLTVQGQKEAQQAAEKLRGMVLDRAFTSPLERARRTLTIVLETLGQNDIPIQIEDGFKARNYGDLQGENKDEMRVKHGADQVHLWRRSYDVPPPGGESLQQAQQRVQAAFDELVRPRWHQGENILIVSHGNALRSLAMHLKGLSPDEVRQLEIPTGQSLMFTLDPDGSASDQGVL
ncbi:MAG: 2,3-diphosphoglycerate-dependent phosphoglycerate mutase [Chloroflexi bacterium]|nr:2,3-diphosphoglycerate-dependent phosphoglycerate mutase [Chloroflexota bacterium]